MMLSPETLIPLAVFVAMTLGTWVVLGLRGRRGRRSAEDRLQAPARSACAAARPARPSVRSRFRPR